MIYINGTSPLGAVLFGIATAINGYCPGTALAASATGSLHALAGVFGMLAGAIAFALSFDWIKANILPIGASGAVRLPDLSAISDPVWFAALVAIELGALIISARRNSI